MPISEISKQCGVSEATIYRHIEKFNIKRPLEKMNEGVEYKEIPGFANYKAGRDGSIWSCLTNGGNKSVIWKKLSPYFSTSGFTVSLCNNKEKYVYFVHRLILMTFVGPCPIGMECCHNNGNRLDNNLSNLRWDTHKNNMLDKIKHNTQAKGEKQGSSFLKETQVKEIKYLLSNRIISKRRLSRLLNIDKQIIININNEVTWKHVK